MNKSVDAIFENGAFHPVGDVDIPLLEGTRVRISIESVDRATTEENVLDLAAKVYAGLSEKEIVAIEQVATNRSCFFTT